MKTALILVVLVPAGAAVLLMVSLAIMRSFVKPGYVHGNVDEVLADSDGFYFTQERLSELVEDSADEPETR